MPQSILANINIKGADRELRYCIYCDHGKPDTSMYNQ